MKSSWQHQKEAPRTDKKNLSPDEHVIEEEKHKLDHRDDTEKEQALQKHPEDSERK